MPRTRAAPIVKENYSDRQVLKYVAKSTDNGFPVPEKTLLSISNRKTIASLHDAGLIRMRKTSYGYMFTITAKGRRAMNTTTHKATKRTSK